MKDEFGKPQSNVLIEIWQANSGKNRHQSDNNDVSLDPNFVVVEDFLLLKMEDIISKQFNLVHIHIQIGVLNGDQCIFIFLCLVDLLLRD